MSLIFLILLPPFLFFCVVGIVVYRSGLRTSTQKISTRRTWRRFLCFALMCVCECVFGGGSHVYGHVINQLIYIMPVYMGIESAHVNAECVHAHMRVIDYREL